LALLELSRVTGEKTWLELGESLATASVGWIGSMPNPHGLFRGNVGLGLVAAEALS
jgi:hypothetical protein